jgi:hypothetical protein
LTGHRTPLHDGRFATPYGLRYAAVSPYISGPQQALRKLHGRLGRATVINTDGSTQPPPGNRSARRAGDEAS